MGIWNLLGSTFSGAFYSLKLKTLNSMKFSYTNSWVTFFSPLSFLSLSVSVFKKIFSGDLQRGKGLEGWENGL